MDEAPRTVLCGESKYKKIIRHAMILDSTGESIKISIWANLIEEVIEDINYSIKDVALEYINRLRLNTNSRKLFLKKKNR